MESSREEVISESQKTPPSLPTSEVNAEGHNHSSEILRDLHNLFNTMFTKENIEADAYLQAHMSSAMVIPIVAVINHQRVSGVTNDDNIIRHALATCPAVTLIEDNVRPIFKVEQNTIILRDIASATSSDELLQLFKATPDCPAVKSIRSDMNDTWFVAFHNEEAARAALLAIRNATFNDKPVRARLKTESITKSYFSAPSPRYRAGEGGAAPHAPHAAGPPQQIPPEYYYRVQQGGGHSPMASPSAAAGMHPPMFYYPPNFLPPGSPMYMHMPPPPHHWQGRGGGRHGKGGVSPRQGGVGGWASSPQSPRGTPMAISHKYPPVSSPQPMYMPSGQIPQHGPPHMVMMMQPPPHAVYGHPQHGHPHHPHGVSPREDIGHTQAPIPPHHHQQHVTSPPTPAAPAEGSDNPAQVAGGDASRNKGATIAGGPKRNRSGSGNLTKKKGDVASSTTPRSGGAGKKGAAGPGKGGGGRGNKGGRGHSAPAAPIPAADFNMESDFPALDNAPAATPPLLSASPANQTNAPGGAESDVPTQGSWAAAVKKRPSNGSNSSTAPSTTADVSITTSVALNSSATIAADDSAENATVAPTARRPSKSISIIDPIAEGLVEHNSFAHYRPPTPVAPPLSPCTAREVSITSQQAASSDVTGVSATSPVENGRSDTVSPTNNSNSSVHTNKLHDSVAASASAVLPTAAAAVPTATASAPSSSSGKVSFRDVVRRGKP